MVVHAEVPLVPGTEAHIGDYCIVPDVPITKRKAFTYVYGPAGDILYVGVTFKAAWEYLLGIGCARVVMITERPVILTVH